MEVSGKGATATESISTYEYDEKNILKVSTIKTANLSITINYTFDDAKKTLTGTNGKTGNDKVEQVIKYDDKLNTSEISTTLYPGGNKATATIKYNANGLEIEEDQAKNNTKTEYNDNFQKTKETYVDKVDASKNSTTTYVYDSNGYLAKRTVGSTVSDTYVNKELDKQNNWTESAKTSGSNVEVTTREFVY